MAQNVLKRKTGVIVGDDVLNLFKFAQEKGFAIPAIVRYPIPTADSLTPNLERHLFVHGRLRP